MSTAPVAAPRAGAAASGALLEPRVARLVAFVALASFGAAGWGSLVTPSAAGRLLLCVAAAAAGGALLSRMGARDARTRALATAAVGVALAAVALLAAEIPARMLFPDAWGTLGSGIGQGISALPGVSVPYRGVDEWARTTLILGGGLLVGLAALLAFRPGPEPRGAGGAAVALGVLYAVPVVEHNPSQPFLSGALFAVLLCGFLWLERLERRFAVPALVAVVGAALAGVVVAPALDTSRPWLDYEQLAQDLAPRNATRFDWDHSYGELDWPRDGRELVRIRARSASYWKVTNLEQFDGVRWRRETVSRPLVRDTEFNPRHPEWFQSLRVVVRNLSTRDFVGAGTIEEISRSPRLPVRSAAGLFASATRPLRRGNAYAARVYVPKPSEEELRGAGSRYPGYVLDDLAMQLPGRVGGPGRPDGAGSQIVFAPVGRGERGDRPRRVRRPGRDRVTARAALALRPDAAPGPAAAGGVHHAVRLRAPRAAARAGRRDVQREPAAGHGAARRLHVPHRGSATASSSRARWRCCCAWAASRPASPRASRPARWTARRGEYVVRDIDAHSWVEAYFPGHGWVTFDPTPSIAPPRDAEHRRALRRVARRPVDRPGGARATCPHGRRGPGARRGDDGGGWPQPWLAAVAAALVLAAALAVRRLRRAGAPAALDDDPVLRRAAGRAAPHRPHAAGRDDARAPGDDPRRIARRARLPARAARPALRGDRGRRPDPDAAGAPRAAPGARPGPRHARPDPRLVGAATASARPEPGVHSGLMDEPVYDLFRNGTRLLEDGDFHAATVPLQRARDLAPDKDSVREALGRALFGAQRYARGRRGVPRRRRPRADERLRALLPRALLQLMGRHAEARHPLALAAQLRPDRKDYGKYLNQARRARPPRRARGAPSSTRPRAAGPAARSSSSRRRPPTRGSSACTHTAPASVSREAHERPPAVAVQQPCGSADRPTQTSACDPQKPSRSASPTCSGQPPTRC